MITHLPASRQRKPFPHTALASAILLAGSGVLHAETNPQQLTTVNVTATAEADAASLNTVTSNGTLGSAKVLDTPFSISSVTEKSISERQVNSLETLFAGDASVTILGNTYSNWGDTMTVRGLPLNYTNSYKLNGMPLSNFSGQLPYEILERVDLLKGATGFMYGFAAPGGIVNYVTKRPTENNLLSLGVGYRSDGILSQSLDVGGRAGNDKQFGYRLNVAHENGDTVQDNGAIQRKTVALSLDARLTPALTWTGDFIYNDRNVDNTTSYINWNHLAATDALIAPVKGSRNLGLPGTFEQGKNLIAQTGLAWQFADDWKASVSYSHTENNTHWVKTLVDLLDSAGNLDLTTYEQYFDTDFNMLQGMVEGQFRTGALNHKLVAGLSQDKTISYFNNPRKMGWSVATDNLYAPQPLPTYSSTLARSTEKGSYVEQKSAFLSDTIEFSPLVSLLAGVRWTGYEAAQGPIRGGNWTPYKKNVATPTVALILKPATNTTVYASYVEALEQGSTVDAANGYATSQMLPPLKSKQYEIGVKREEADWNATAAIFRIERGAEYDVGAAPAMVRVQDGIQNYDGIELGGAVRPTSNLELASSLMYLRATYEDMGPTSTINGNDVAAAPKVQGTAQATYALPGVPGLKLNAGAKYHGKAALDQNNNWDLPAYTLLDAGVSYTTHVSGHGLTLRGGVNNLTDKKYWATNGWGSLRIGEPRSVAVSAQLDW